MSLPAVLTGSIAAITAVVLVVSVSGAEAASRGGAIPAFSSIMTNTFGYIPDQPKRVLYRGAEAQFTIADADTGETVYSGALQLCEAPDLSVPDLRCGDFTGFRQPGRYVIRIGDAVSHPFRIAPNLYGELVWNGVNYLQQVRAGDSVTGFRAWTHNASHLDDGLLSPELARELGLTNRWFDLVGGWYDATDVRYWASSWMALEWVHSVAGELRPAWTDTMLLDELKWGNVLFLKSILPDGRILGPRKSDNYWTDNVIGSRDDRVVSTGTNASGTAYELVYHLLRLARIYKDVDPEYAAAMQRAAERGHRWLIMRGSAGDSLPTLGQQALVYIEMYRLSGNRQWLELARANGRRILAAQEQRFVGGQQLVRGFFYADSARTKTPDIRCHEGYFLLALVELAQVDAGNPAWLEALELYCTEYLQPLAMRNPFHLAPARAFLQSNVGRRLDDSRLTYRLFRNQGDAGNATGINASILFQASVLLEVASLANRPDLTSLGWEQLNFILGANPFGASTVEGAGYVPTRFIGGQGITNTFPRIPGAVLNGIASDENDQPRLDNGWEASEYWLPQFGLLGRALAAARIDPSYSTPAMLPQRAVLKTGRSQRFTLSTAAAAEATWLVDGVVGGDSTLGTVVDGVYVAPAQPLPRPVVLQAVGRDGAELGRAEIRVIDQPGQPQAVLTQTATESVLEWQPVTRADAYNVEMLDELAGVWRIVHNTTACAARLPLAQVQGKRLRVVAVSHSLGYGLPSAELQLQ